MLVTNQVANPANPPGSVHLTCPETHTRYNVRSPVPHQLRLPARFGKGSEVSAESQGTRKRHTRRNDQQSRSRNHDKRMKSASAKECRHQDDDREQCVLQKHPDSTTLEEMIHRERAALYFRRRRKQIKPRGKIISSYIPNPIHVTVL